MYLGQQKYKIIYVFIIEKFKLQWVLNKTITRKIGANVIFLHYKMIEKTLKNDFT